MRRILLALAALLLVGGAFVWWSLVPPAPPVMIQWMTAEVLPALSARNSVGIRLNTSSRIFVRASDAMTSAIFESGVDLTS